MRRGGLVLALLLGCSGALEGEVVTDPVVDWSFVATAQDVAFTAAGGETFTTVVANPVVHEGKLYLSVSTLFTFDDDALDAILAGEARSKTESRLTSGAPRNYRDEQTWTKIKT